MVVARNLGQQVALSMGWDGSGQGQGGHNAWVASLNPAQRAQYDASLGGTAPALVEPLHAWEKEGLTGLSQGADTSGMAAVLAEMKARLGGALDTAGGYTGSAVKPVTAEEIAARQNPFASAMNTQLEETAAKIRADAIARQGMRGGRSFGDTATGTQLGLIDQELMSGINTNNFNTWNSALEQINAERNRYLTGANTALTGAQVGTQGSGMAFDMAKGISDTGLDNALQRMKAGKYVREYNQGVNDLMLADTTAAQGDDYDRLLKTLSMLGNYGSNLSSSSGQRGGMESPLMQIGKSGLILSSLPQMS